MRDPTEQWRQFGKKDPFYGVLSDEQFRSGKMTPEVRARFYATGEQHVETIFEGFADWRPARALDFGCGVGRLVVPFASRCDEVVGVDVSPDALREARSACEQQGITNVAFSETIDGLGQFDLIHSTIVLQHIPTKDGYLLFDAMVESLNAGGRGVIQITVGASPAVRMFYFALRFSTVASAWNRLRRRPSDYPTMQMNAYSLRRILMILHRRGISDVGLSFVPSAGGNDLDSAVLRFQR